VGSGDAAVDDLPVGDLSAAILDLAWVVDRAVRDSQVYDGN
jgi:hypothetical protein